MLEYFRFYTCITEKIRDKLAWKRSIQALSSFAYAVKATGKVKLL